MDLLSPTDFHQLVISMLIDLSIGGYLPYQTSRFIQVVTQGLDCLIKQAELQFEANKNNCMMLTKNSLVSIVHPPTRLECTYQMQVLVYDLERHLNSHVNIVQRFQYLFYLVEANAIMECRKMDID